MARVFRSGTAKQLAERAAGYSASGESAYSRNVASVNIKLAEGKRSNGRLIRQTSRELAKLEYRATIETDPARRAKHLKNAAIKTAFLAKLKNQFVGEHPGDAWDAVTTIPGEGSFLPWDKVKG